VFSSVFKVIEPGKVGVQVLFGKVQPMYAGKRAAYLNPLVDVTTFDIRTQNYTMSAVHNEGDICRAMMR
jgi:hypothetical protein